MLELFKLDHTNRFPAVDFALIEPNGLLAFGGDLSAERLLEAYKHGIFPWFSEGDPYLWWSPDPRGILALEDFHCSKSFRKSLRKNQYRATLNNNFLAVINECASIPRKSPGLGNVSETNNLTWITPEMKNAYVELHHKGYAHSIEIWDKEILVGGLYGVAVGGVFCGESMFHRKTDASKAALYALVLHMKNHNMGFIDCQMETEHLRSLGCQEVDRELFIDMLDEQLTVELSEDCWRAQSLGILV
ncbi:leucyl/phenylalanyl-tRNA--protein transferase [Glaciecola sp. MH2013]|uniref:leucyl/phenylalanyl-tRNA--protein transferase n=1 Tax=Glaciecola sp. MH2013 TaxID=2785524 RepID=UPI00189E38A5|nr:leucyl/phenylalanyl-tRNA--protein transferase [Glaciecola sp. MH2013]MBF7072582.1 leucyl/phenylalanyl-tRNA--protein transferase [Glaciecola sp. MH2013]